MTTKQLLSSIVHHGLTAVEIDSLAAELAATPTGRRIAGKAISSGTRKVSPDDRQRRAERMRDINIEKARKNKAILQG